MRLIDADALRYEIAKYFNGLPIQGHYDMLKMVDEAPTVDTEPIEDSARMRGFTEGYLQGVKDGRNDKRNDK